MLTEIEMNLFNIETDGIDGLPLDRFKEKVTFLWDDDNRASRDVVLSSMVKKLSYSLERQNYSEFLEIYNLFKSLYREYPMIIHYYIFRDLQESTLILHDICRSVGNHEVANIVIRYGGKLTLVADLDKAALHVAVEHSDYETLMTVLSYVTGEVNIIDKNGNTALHIAVELKKIQFINQLLQQSHININIRNSNKQTPLHVAISKGHREIIDILLQHPNADLDTLQDSYGKTCRQLILIKYPEYQNELPPVDNTASKEKMIHVLFSLVYAGDTKLFNEIACRVEKEWLNADDGFHTLLQYACYSGFADTVETLVNLQVDPGRRCLTDGMTSTDGMTPLHIAVTEGHLDIVQILVTKCGHQLLKTTDGRTILHEIYDYQYKRKCYEYDKLSNSDEPWRGKFQRYHRWLFKEVGKPLTRDNIECLKFILEVGPRHGLNIKAVDNYTGESALHLAVDRDYNSEVIDMLLSAGTYPCLQSTMGVVPLRYIDVTTLERFLDSCTKIQHTGVKDGVKVYFDYKMLRLPRDQQLLNRLENWDLGSNSKQTIISEIEPLLVINDVPELKRLLKHPLLRSFLLMKWYSIKKYFYYNLFFYFTFLIASTSYILYDSYFSIDASSNDKMPFSPQPILKRFHSKFDIIIWAIIVTLSGFLFFREFQQFCLSPRSYMRSRENWLEIIMICVTVMFLFYPVNDDLRSSLAAFSILASWMELILLIGRHPLFATNIEMFKTVSSNFFKFLAWYSILIVAFAFSFYVLFHSKINNDNFFDNLFLSIFKSYIMLTGEFEAGNIPFSKTIFTSYLIFLLFVFYIAIVLFNLLNGLAVSDTHTIRENAELLGLISLLNLISYMETVATNTLLLCKKPALNCMLLKPFTNLCRNRAEALHKKITLYHHKFFDEPISFVYAQGNITWWCDDYFRKFDRDQDFRFVVDAIEMWQKKNHHSRAFNYEEYSEQMRRYEMKFKNLEDVTKRNEKLLRDVTEEIRGLKSVLMESVKKL